MELPQSQGGGEKIFSGGRAMEKHYFKTAEFAALCGNHMDGNVPEVSADDQAHAILFFASDEAKGVNGQVLTVDNGMTI